MESVSIKPSWRSRVVSIFGGGLLLGGLTAGLSAAAGTLSVENGQAALPTGQEVTVYVKVAIRPPALPDTNVRTPLNLVLVLDQSGSMSGDRIQYAKRAANRLIEISKPEDKIGLVAFSSDAKVLLPSAEEINKTKAVAAVNKLSASGSTALHAGVSLGADQLIAHLDSKRVNRVVLLSDGEANVGPQTPEELAALGRKLGSKGISVTTVGLGLDYNETLMARLAGASDGNHVFVKAATDLESIFQEEFMDAATVVARNASIKVICEDGVTPVRVLGYDGKIDGSTVTVEIPQLQADQEKYAIIEAKVKTGTAPGSMNVVKVMSQYTVLADGREVSEEGDSTVRVVADAAEAAKSQNVPVMEKVVLQTAADNNDKALAAINEGDLAKGQALLQENRVMLDSKATEYQSKELQELSSQVKDYEGMAAAPAQAPQMKKSMQQGIYNEKTQKKFK